MVLPYHTMAQCLEHTPKAELVSPSSWGLSPALQRVPWPEPSLFFPLHFSCMQKKKKKNLGPGFLCQVLYKYLILLFSMCEYIKHSEENMPKNHMLSLQESLVDSRHPLVLSIAFSNLGHLHNQHWPVSSLPTFCGSG